MKLSTHTRNYPQSSEAAPEQAALVPVPDEATVMDTGDDALLLSVEEVAKSLHISRTKVFALLRDGEVASVTIGTRRLVLQSDLVRIAPPSYLHGASQLGPPGAPRRRAPGRPRARAHLVVWSG